MTKRMLIMIGGILVLVLILAGGFALHIKKLIASAPKPTPQTVTATKVSSQDWQPALAAVGSVLPVRGVDVTTEIAGLVREIHFKSGQDVKKGEILVELNADSDKAQLASLEAAAARLAQIHDPVDYERCRFDLFGGSHLVGPVKFQPPDIRRRYLIQPRVAMCAVVARICEPVAWFGLGLPQPVEGYLPRHRQGK